MGRYGSHPEAKRTQVWETPNFLGWEASQRPSHTRGAGEAKPKYQGHGSLPLLCGGRGKKS